MNTVKNTKRFITAIVVLILCGIMNVSATDKIELEVSPPDGRNITITGKLPMVGARVYVEVVRKDEELKGEVNIYAAEQVKVTNDGKFIVKFTMPEYDRAVPGKYVDGYFTAYAFSKGYEKAELDFSYIDEESRTAFFENLNDAKKSKENMKAFILDTDNKIFFNSYQILIDEYASIAKSDIQLFATELICQIKDSIGEDDIADINEIIIAMRCNLADSTEKIEALLSDEDILSRCDINLDNVDEEQKKWFIESVLHFVNGDRIRKVSDLDTIFTRSQILYELNNVHYSDAYKVLSKYEGELELNKCDAYSKIKNLNENAVGQVMKNLRNLTKTIKSTDELHEKLNAAYAEYTKTIVKITGSSGSSGGGSHSGKGSGTGLIIGGIKEVVTEAPPQSKVIFNDISNVDWAKTAIDALANADIISGDGNGYFRPMDMVTRAEFIKMLVSALNIAKTGESDFSDVPSSDWSYHYVSAAYSSGIAVGVGNNLFGKNSTVTRQEAVVFLHRAAIREFIPLAAERSGSFADDEDIADWAKRSVGVMYNAGYINGLEDNRFGPNEGLTRAQAAVMVYSLYNTL